MASGDWIERLGEIATAWGSDLVVVSIKTTVVLAVAALVLRSTRRASASFRHLVLFVAITSPVALALLPHVLPRWRSPIPAATMTGWSSRRAATGPAGGCGAADITTRGFRSSSLMGEALPETQPLKPGALGLSAQLHPQAAVVPEWSVPAHVWLFVLWLAGVGLLAAHLFLAHLRLRTECRATMLVDDSKWNKIVGEYAKQCSVSQCVSLTFSATQSMPMVCGIRKPRIVLPGGAVTWSAEVRRAVLQHELAHIARRDCLTSLIARSICILHWFNPFAWGVLRMMKNERERACDDLVLSTGLRASTYARQVLSVATRFGKRNSFSAGLAMARASQLQGRLLAVLDSRRSRRRITRRSGFCTIGLAMLMLVPIATITTATAVTDSGQASDGRSDEQSESAEDSKRAYQPDSESVRTANPYRADRIDSPWKGNWSGSYEYVTNDGIHRCRWRSEQCEASILIEGRLEFAPDLKSIARMAPGARMQIDEMLKGTKRTLEVHADPAGLPTFTFSENKQARPCDGEVLEWFSDILDALCRTSDYELRQRARLVSSYSDPQRVVNAVMCIRDAHIRTTFIDEIVKISGARRAQLVELFMDWGLLEKGLNAWTERGSCSAPSTPTPPTPVGSSRSYRPTD